VVKPQDFDVITTHTVDGDVVLVQNQFTGTGHPTGPAYARIHLQFGHGVLQRQHKAACSRSVVLGNEASNVIEAV